MVFAACLTLLLNFAVLKYYKSALQTTMEPIQLNDYSEAPLVQSNSLFLRFADNQVLWLVSAYVDPRYERMVRVVAAGNRSLLKYKSRCNFFYERNSFPEQSLTPEYVFQLPIKVK